MLPTVTGLIVIALGIWCQFGSPSRTLVAILALTLFEAADAADLVALGGQSVTPAKLFLVFFVLRVLSIRNGGSALLAELSPRRPLFIYLLLILWVVASALLFPRLFEGTTAVYSLDHASIDEGAAVPLRPSSGNITQSVYAIGSFVIALGVGVLARRKGGYATVLTGLLIVTGLDIALAFADLATAATHTDFLLDPLHTGNYTFLTSDESGGMKRISGSFSEASAFATFSLELLAINLSLFVNRVRPRLTGSFCAILFALLFLSTSSTAYVGLAVYAAAFGAYAVWMLVRRGSTRSVKILGIATGLAVFGICIVILAVPSLATAAWTMIDTNILQKGTSDSAIERGEINVQAAKVFFDTYGVGAGIGSTRASNFFLVLASNLGVVGLVLFALVMLALTFLRPRADIDPQERCIVDAARVGMLASLVPVALIGTIFDLGPLFYVLVGVVASSAPAAGVRSLSREAPKPRAMPALAGRRY